MSIGSDLVFDLPDVAVGSKKADKRLSKAIRCPLRKIIFDFVDSGDQGRRSDSSQILQVRTERVGTLRESVPLFVEEVSIAVDVTNRRRQERKLRSHPCDRAIDVDGADEIHKRSKLGRKLRLQER
jgi:hypothetical protein